jgi:hypothetical protein
MIAQSALNQNLGKSSYLKIVCMRNNRAAELFHQQHQNASVWSEPAAHRDAIDYDEVPGAPDADDEPGAGDESSAGPGQ